MATINLLPKSQIISMQLIIFILINLMIVIFLHTKCHAIMAEKQEKIKLLKKEIQAICSETSILSSKNKDFIPPQNKNYIQIFDLLKKLPMSIPIGLYLTELSTAKNGYTLIGRAEKTFLISQWAKKLNHLGVNVSVKEISRKKEEDDFPMEFWVLIFSGEK